MKKETDQWSRVENQEQTHLSAPQKERNEFVQQIVKSNFFPFIEE